MLVIGMIAGASIYLIYHSIPAFHPAGPVLLKIVKALQPALLFSMLFLTFSRIEPSDMRPHRWHWWLLAVQGLSFIVLAVAVCFLPEQSLARPVIESAMLCLICPTATAAAVVTDRLGGEMAGILTYTILINILTAILVPLFVPLIHPVAGLGFFQAFLMIMAKVFPLLICPCLLAWLVRYMAPRLHRKLTTHKSLAFYIWASALVLALLMTTRAIVQSSTPTAVLAAMALASLATCAFQFWIGKLIGARYDREYIARGRAAAGTRLREITAGQSIGQKNTVFAIWMGYTFMDPVSSVSGGLYSIWHNIYNSYQLKRISKR